MWPFKTSPSLEKQVKTLQDTCDALERGWKRMQIEWEETYEKTRLLHMRVAKRVKTLEAQAPEGEATQPLGGEDVNPEGSNHQGPHLTPRQLQLNNQILARRGRMRPNGGT